MEPMTFDQLKEEVDRFREKKKKEKASASPQPSVTRSGASYQITQGDVQRVDLVRLLFRPPAEPLPFKLKENAEQEPTVATAAAEKAAADVAALKRAAAEQTLKENNKLKENAEQVPTVATAAAEKAAADVAALERAAAEQTLKENTAQHMDAIEQVATNADAEVAATINNLHEEINRLRLLLTAEQAAAAAARAAVDEAAATINNLEVENKRILLLLAAEQADTTVKVFVPALTNEPSWKGHIPSQPGALTAKSSPSTYAQALMMNSEPSTSLTVKRSTKDHYANAASASATAGPEPAKNSSVQQHKPAENLAAAALQAAADAAATAAEDPRILRAVLMAAAATARALAQDTGTVQPRRRGGRPPSTRTRRPKPNRPRRPRKSAGTVAPGPPEPTATGTAKQLRWTHQPTASGSSPRGGQKARRQTGTFFARSDIAVTSLPATRNVPPKIEPTLTRLTGRD